MANGSQDLIRSWNNVGIVKGFLGFLRRRLQEIRLGPKKKSVASLHELGEAFAEGWLGYGDLVTIRGRLSRFAPIYFPVAYSPQIPGVLTGGQLLMATLTMENPAPGAVSLRHVDGGIMAYLYPEDARGTPRITSLIHPDRLITSHNRLPLPYSKSAPSIPVLISDQQLRWLEDKVEMAARIRPLDDGIDSEIAASSQDFVRLHYHGFYRSDWFPDHGFMLDAREATAGSIRQFGEPSSFLVNLAVEAEFESSLSQDEVEDAFNRTLDGLELPEISIRGANGSRANYTPAYFSPGGYQIVQVNKLPVALHLAYEKQVLQASVVSHSDGRLPLASRFLQRAVLALHDELKRRDQAIRFKVLFSSDRTLGQVLNT